MGAIVSTIPSQEEVHAQVFERMKAENIGPRLVMSAPRAASPWSTPADEQVDVSDDELAQTFTRKHANDLRYVPAWGTWLTWDGKRWARDEKRRVFDHARAVCRQASDEQCAKASGEDQRKRIRARLGSAQTVWNVVKLAATDPRHAVTVDQLDADPWSLNTPDGILNLRNGHMRPHNPAELHTKITVVGPGEDSALWIRFLERIQPDASVRDYLQRLAGYGMTGSSREHVLPFFYGTGRNGKGTFVHTLRAALGDYAVEIAAELLMESNHDRHPTELTVLLGSRLAVGSEVDTGRRWNESRLKRLTGGDPIAARYIKGNPFEFQPTHTLVIVGNHKPGLRAVDEAIASRMHLVPFAVTVPAAERDPELPDKLQAELGGILSWMLDGCLAWQEQGLNPPPAVLDATQSYLDAEDGIGAWLEECCQRRGEVTLKAAHRSYRDWCETNAQPALGRNTFADQLAGRNLPVSRNKSSNVTVISGLQLKSQVGGYDPD